MSNFISDLLNWIRDRLQGPGAIEPSVEPDPAPSLAPKVLVLNYDPIVHSRGGRRLHEVFGWNDPRALTDAYIADLSECSGEYVQYQVVAWEDVDAFPVKADSFQYTEESYLHCRDDPESCHDNDLVDYLAIFEEFGIPQQVEQGEIDEVWLWGFPYAGYRESTMAGQGAYFCNSYPVEGVDIPRIFVTMGFNYERGVGEMLENFGHRVESIMRHVYGSEETEEMHAWKRFTLYDQEAPGRAACGMVHFAPNSEDKYDWDNRRMVSSNCDDWLKYPDLTGERRQVNCEEWGNGDARAYQRWWLRHLPRAQGRSEGKLNNWWAYVVDFNRFAESR